MSGRTQRQDGQARRSAPAGSAWARAVRGPWTVICVVAAVVVGPAAATASALDRANAAPPLHAPEHESAKSLV
ncbi:hypothetical protein AQI88_05975 [Streptomyces cellostaticus]|uniref:Uncharacterized protein n=1 Tax=Streptomyces cellostaticus TaxID=67285 RepID=A0A101NR88_9ACTN|nr:hypothetical protein [Streptomyces cellostaticus]KUM97769.1 hypothetical protein AQI88_05975 [Streptomyces cellostaticus]GHI08269.1 hypothetical protein Scel_65900 [Streptomyces cellostaticus]